MRSYDFALRIGTLALLAVSGCDTAPIPTSFNLSVKARVPGEADPPVADAQVAIDVWNLETGTLESGDPKGGQTDDEGNVDLELADGTFYVARALKDGANLDRGEFYFELGNGDTGDDLSALSILLFRNDGSSNSECNTAFDVPTAAVSDSSFGGAFLRVYKRAGPFVADDTLTVTLFAGKGETVAAGADLATAETADGTANYLDVYDGGVDDESEIGHYKASLWANNGDGDRSLYTVTLNDASAVIAIDPCTRDTSPTIAL